MKQEKVSVYMVFVYTDPDSGELLNEVREELSISELEAKKIVKENKGVVPPHSNDEKFVIVNLILLSTLIKRRKQISPLALFIMFYMLLNSKFNENIVGCTQKKLAIDLSVSEGKISEALRELYDLNFCHKNKLSGGGTYFIINPEFARKGIESKKVYTCYYNSLNANNSNIKVSYTPSEKCKENIKSVKNSIQQSIKFGSGKKLLSLIEYLTNKFKHNRVIDLTIPDIVNATGVQRLTVMKFLKLLETKGFIKRGYGKLELIVPYKDLEDCTSGVL